MPTTKLSVILLMKLLENEWILNADGKVQKLNVSECVFSQCQSVCPCISCVECRVWIHYCIGWYYFQIEKSNGTTPSYNYLISFSISPSLCVTRFLLDISSNVCHVPELINYPSSSHLHHFNTWRKHIQSTKRQVHMIFIQYKMYEITEFLSSIAPAIASSSSHVASNYILCYLPVLCFGDINQLNDWERWLHVRSKVYARKRPLLFRFKKKKQLTIFICTKTSTRSQCKGCLQFLNVDCRHNINADVYSALNAIDNF